MFATNRVADVAAFAVQCQVSAAALIVYKKIKLSTSSLSYFKLKVYLM